MVKLSALFAAAGLALCASVPSSWSADYEHYWDDRYYHPYPDSLRSCMELAREEGHLVIRISALHPLLKVDDPEAEAEAAELNARRKVVHRHRVAVQCI